MGALREGELSCRCAITGCSSSHSRRSHSASAAMYLATRACSAVETLHGHVYVQNQHEAQWHNVIAEEEACAHQVRNAGGHAGNRPAIRKCAQQPHPGQHVALGRRGQREGLVCALRARRRQARRCVLLPAFARPCCACFQRFSEISNQHGARWRALACGNEIGRQRRGGHAALGRERLGRAAAQEAGAAAARSGLDRAAAARRHRGRPVQLPQAAPELWYAALPRLLRGRGRRVCAAGAHTLLKWPTQSANHLCTGCGAPPQAQAPAPVSAASADSVGEAVLPSSLVSEASAAMLTLTAWSSAPGPGCISLSCLAARLHLYAGAGGAGRTFQTQGSPQHLVPAPAWLSACCAQQRPAARESSTRDQHTDAPVSCEVVHVDPARVVAGLKRVLQAAARRLEGIPPLQERACAQAQERAA